MADILDNVIEQYAPFLSHYWLHLLSIGIAFLIVSLIKSVSRQDDAFVQDTTKDLAPLYNEDEGNQIPYIHANKISQTEMTVKANDFYNFMNTRRSVRFISKEPVPSLDVIKTIVRTAGTAPSGAHMQPWTFVVVSSSKVRTHTWILPFNKSVELLYTGSVHVYILRTSERVSTYCITQ